MSISKQHYETFKRGSKTYFNSSIFFPKSVREDVFLLYGFVRVADDFVDSIPADPEGFYRFRERYHQARKGAETGDPIIDGYAELERRKGFDPGWADAFLSSMEMDITKKEYNTLDETLQYIYGSAEVIGLYMAKILSLPEESYYCAQMLGRAMQFINFIRDINEDLTLGRRYLPLTGTSLSSLNEEAARKDPDTFLSIVRHHLSLYKGWQEEAEKGYRYIPKRYLIPIKTAADMYNWTASVIEKDPFVVFQRKVKPAKGRIILRALGNVFSGESGVSQKGVVPV